MWHGCGWSGVRPERRAACHRGRAGGRFPAGLNGPGRRACPPDRGRRAGPEPYRCHTGPVLSVPVSHRYGPEEPGTGLARDA